MNSSSWFFLCNNVHCITHALPWTHLNSPRSPFCVCWPILFVPLLLAHFLWDFSCWKIRKFIDFMAFTHFIAFNKWPSLCQSTLRWATHLLLRYLVWFVDLLPVAQILPFLYFWLFWCTPFYTILFSNLLPPLHEYEPLLLCLFLNGTWFVICYSIRLRVGMAMYGCVLWDVLCIRCLYGVFKVEPALCSWMWILW